MTNSDRIIQAVICGGEHEINGRGACIMCGYREVCEYCDGTGIYINRDEKAQVCICNAGDAMNEEMIKGGEMAHDND